MLHAWPASFPVTVRKPDLQPIRWGVVVLLLLIIIIQKRHDDALEHLMLGALQTQQGVGGRRWEQAVPFRPLQKSAFLPGICKMLRFGEHLFMFRLCELRMDCEWEGYRWCFLLKCYGCQSEATEQCQR